MLINILGIESSCDDTSAAIITNNQIRANIVANQDVHRNFGGVVPELASRAHQQNIIPVIDQALKHANIDKKSLHAVAFTRGPGLLGSLLVGVSFAKAFAFALDIPLIEVDHMQAHILAHFIQNDAGDKPMPEFPFLCLTVSGGHTQIVLVKDYFSMEVLGQTIDDAAGEAFDKAAKILGLPYPGGPLIDLHAKTGNPKAFAFARPQVAGLNFSFSGLKTSFLYFLRDRLRESPTFDADHMDDLCASIQQAIVNALMEKLQMAVKQTGVKDVAIAGGVSANSGLRQAMLQMQETIGCRVFIPEMQYSTDNAAMIAIAGYYKYLRNDFGKLSDVPYSRAGNGTIYPAQSPEILPPESF
jgi:N6-L-threonylcarbamoyladenine synthase